MVPKVWWNTQKSKKRKSSFFLMYVIGTGNGNICILCHNFWTNQNLNPLGISKWPSEHQFCESYLARNGLKTAIYQSDASPSSFQVVGHFRQSYYFYFLINCAAYVTESYFSLVFSSLPWSLSLTPLSFRFSRASLTSA